MSRVPEPPNARYLRRVAISLFSQVEEQERFCAVFSSPNSEERESAAIWLKSAPQSGQKVWESEIATVISAEERNELRDCHDRGEIYLFDPSSLFCASVLRAIPHGNIGQILDLCSAPGGKGIYAWRLFGAPFVIFNEVTQSRLAGLISNLKRCQIAPCGVATRNANFFATRSAGMFDVTLVDAPCSGQSLLLKGTKNPGCFNPHTIAKNAGRQRGILAQAAGCVAPGGYLAYMTCTFATEENEEIVDSFVARNPEFRAIEAPHLRGFQSVHSTNPCYRLFPWQGGAGGFAALLQRQGELVPGTRPDLQYCWESGRE